MTIIIDDRRDTGAWFDLDELAVGDTAVIVKSDFEAEIGEFFVVCGYNEFTTLGHIDRDIEPYIWPEDDYSQIKAKLVDCHILISTGE